MIIGLLGLQHGRRYASVLEQHHKREAILRARQRLAGQRVARTGTTWTFGLSIASPEASCTGPRQSRTIF